MQSKTRPRFNVIALRDNTICKFCVNWMLTSMAAQQRAFCKVNGVITEKDQTCTAFAIPQAGDVIGVTGVVEPQPVEEQRLQIAPTPDLTEVD